MESVAILDYRKISDNLDAWCLRRPHGAVIDVTMLTMWHDRQCIEAFAGKAIDHARYYDFDDRFLLRKEDKMTHREVGSAQIAETLGEEVQKLAGDGRLA